MTEEIDLGIAVQKAYGSIPEKSFEQDYCTDEDFQPTDKIFQQTFYGGEDLTNVVDLGYFPQEGIATVNIAGYTVGNSVAEAIENLQLMELRLAALGSRGYDVSAARLVEEDQTTDSKRYEVDVPIAKQAELDQLVLDLQGIVE
ncbi:hypothetical protein KKA95_03030 [Patescibacteria group bacterium]|nr:hypothetical protein [Patescibacteria group bacterium]MBU1622588.1 hypothetical protein [Nanoarchaeota archaeon]